MPPQRQSRDCRCCAQGEEQTAIGSRAIPCGEVDACHPGSRLPHFPPLPAAELLDRLDALAALEHDIHHLQDLRLCLILRVLVFAKRIRLPAEDTTVEI